MKTIVISAVNLRKGGTLTILQNCLQYLSQLSRNGECNIYALVHKKELAFYEGINYIETPWSTKSWLHRLWCEYVTMYHISKEISPVHLWFSLHDTTPRVKAERRATYCQTSFPFFKWNFNDFRFDYKIPLFALFTRYAYRININKNNYLVVQQEWLREGFSKMFGIAENRFIVAPPEREKAKQQDKLNEKSSIFRFLYPATPDCHKNFELVCKASELLEKELGKNKFKTTITINGQENRYAKWLYKKWGHVSSINFAGFMDKKTLYKNYGTTNCLIFPSRIETWGLPISEFMPYNKPMLLADLPYAKETSAGSEKTDFFDPTNINDLKNKMESLIKDKSNFLKSIPKNEIKQPYTKNWEELFELLTE